MSKKKLSKEEQAIIKTLIIDNGSQYLGKVHQHVEEAAKEHGLENSQHQVQKISVEDLKSAYDKGDPGVLKGFDYVISSGSPKNRKYDTKLHKFVAENLDKKATFLGVCHGAQQYAVSQGAELKKGDYMHRGKREASVNKEYHSHDALKDVVSEKGSMEHHGHHQNYVPKGKEGSKLEIIAEGTAKSGEKFVEMFKAKGKDHYGIQAHPEKGEGKVIKNLFKEALKKTGYDGKNLEQKYAKT